MQIGTSETSFASGCPFPAPLSINKKVFILFAPMISKTRSFPAFPFALFLLVQAAAVSAAAPAAHPQSAPARAAAPAAPALKARAYELMDVQSERTLAGQNQAARMEPASLTKLMTAYVVFKELEAGRLHLNDKVTVSKKAWRTPGSRMFIEVNSQIPVEALIQGMIVQSGNDASVALAEQVAGSEETFASLMNRYAKELGMTGTHYVNATGLPAPEHYTTARDTALLARAIILDFPQYHKWYSQKEFTYNGITQHNRNRLLWRDPSVDGMKTGFTDAAGYCFVASANREGFRLVAVVMGEDTVEARFRESEALLNYGFRNFESRRLYAAGQPVTTVRVYGGEPQELPVGLMRELRLTVPEGQSKALATRTTLKSPLTAPLKKGTAVGQVQVTLNGQPLETRPLVALRAVAEGGIWRTMVDRVSLWVTQLLSD
jgi:serine-type D-Ala-D-Ala carboxypeptidase (penicillin-binding protein 5/6)